MESTGHQVAEIEAVSVEDSFHEILLPTTRAGAEVDLQADESTMQSQQSSSGRLTGVWRALTSGQHPCHKLSAANMPQVSVISY